MLASSIWAEMRSFSSVFSNASGTPVQASSHLSPVLSSEESMIHTRANNTQLLKYFRLHFSFQVSEKFHISNISITIYGVITKDVSYCINLLVRISHIICNHPSYVCIKQVTM